MKPKRFRNFVSRNFPTTAFLAMSVATVSSAFAADIQWDGSDSTDWATGTNWVGNVAPTAADKAFINNITVNTPAVTANATAAELLVGFASTTGAVNLTAGTLTSNSWTVIGNGATGNGTVNITGSGSLSAAATAGNMQIAEVAGSIGVVNVNTTGSLTTNNRELIVGNGGNGTLTVDAGTVSSGGLRVAQNATGAQGTINLNAGSITVGQFARWGASTNAVADINIAAGTTFTVNNSTAAAEGLRMGEGAGSNNTVDVDGTLNFTATQANRIGHNSNSTTATNTVNVNTGGSMYSEGDLILGYSGNTGSVDSLNINGGTVNVASATERWMIVGQWDGLNTNINITNGGTLKLNTNTDLRYGINNNSGDHIINVDGGSIIGYADNGTTTAGATTDIELGRSSNPIDITLNIKNGGLVQCRLIYTNANTTAAVINFDNGTLRASASDPNFIRLNGTGAKQVNILAGGATIDSNGYDVTVGNGLAGTAGGALNKVGAGKLTIDKVNTYNGPTNVNAGTLVMGGTTATSGLTVAASAGLGVEEPSVTLGSLTVPSASFGAGASLNIETDTGNLSEKLVVSNSGGLSFSNLSVNLYDDGGTVQAFAGTYTVIEYNTTYSGISSNITVANPRASWTYNVIDTGSAIQIEVIAGDSDGDGMDDAWETANGLDPFDDGTVNPVNGASGNLDGDFATNIEEYLAGTAANNANDDPFNTDNDGLRDSWEVTNFGNITAQNGSGDPDGDLATNLQEFNASPQTNPNNGDSWPDADTDLMNDAWETAFLGSTGTSNGTADTDSDGFTDKQEHDASTDPSVATGTDVSPIWTALKHRWSFSDLTDSVGGSNATIVDIGVNGVAFNDVLTPTAITMTGGAKADSDYIKLGENLLPNSTSPVTIELWAKQNTIQNWSRIFDFHSGTGETLFMSWTIGVTDASDRVSWADTTGNLTVDNANQPYGTTDEHHIVMTLEPLVGTAGATRVTVYSAPSGATDLGPAQLVANTTVNLVNFQDTLNALGYSPWPDNTASATYNEVRIWNGALSGWMVEKMHDLGPDSVTVDDLDGDHLPDDWEIQYFTNTTTATTLDGDNDGDTISNYAEYVAGSDPNNIASTPSDMDADGLADTWEIANFGNLDQTGSGDPDGDGLTNEQEETGGTNPNDDEDGLPTDYEIFWFGNTTTQGGTTDSDGDGFTNAQEYLVSQPTNANSTPTDVNGDGTVDSLQHKLTASDALGTTSFDTGLNWNDAAAPTAGETYIVTVPNFRTPTVAADIAFAGARLDLVDVSNGAATNGRPQLLLKYSGATPITTTLPLINLNGGAIQNAADVGITHNLAGTINVAGPLKSFVTTNNGPIVVNGVITGSGPLEFVAGNTVTLNGANTFTGNLNVINDNGLILGDTGSMAFDIGSSGVNNVISGTRPVTLNGAFNLDLSGASSTNGDEWDLITSTGALTIGSTFTVTGFTDDGGTVGSRIWTSGSYQYDEATGILSVSAANPDGDGDGMDDAWETTYFGDTSQSAEGDFEGDGTDNLTEFRLGLIPNDGTSRFTVTTTDKVLGDGYTVNWQGAEGVTFVVQRSIDGMDTWTNVDTQAGVAGAMIYTDPSPVAGKAFYRVALQP